MFPPKRETQKSLTIYAGHKISIGIQLVVDGEWRYKLQNNEELTVQLLTGGDEVILQKTFTAADVDEEDKIVNVTFSGVETNLPVGKYYLVALVDDYIVFRPQPVEVRKVAFYE